MLRTRVIPCLLLSNRGLVKTRGFKDPVYIGDPINAVKIFNEKEVDEVIFLDINASDHDKSIDLNLISQMASECFMPVCYGGGVDSVETACEIIARGIEKICINQAALKRPELVNELANKLGSQSVVVAIDVKKDWLGHKRVFDHRLRRLTNIDPVTHAINMAKCGAGEILLNSVDADGSMQGYDIELVLKVAEAVKIPVIASGGAGKLEDLRRCAKEGKASALAAGSMFVFQGRHRAVLISYPSYQELEELLA
jgi:cyclase